MTAMLHIDGLWKSFAGFVATRDVSFELLAGENHAIIGPNGAGKTTFFNVISGMLPADGGRVFFDGRDITRLKPHQISRCGIKRTLQIKSIFPNLSVADNLWITAKAGDRTYEITGSVLSMIPLRNRRKTPEGEQLVTRISEGMTEWKWDGKSGYGLSEYLDQIVDGAPVGAA